MYTLLSLPRLILQWTVLLWWFNYASKKGTRFICVPIECDNAIALRISKKFLKAHSDVIILGVYTPPTDSPSYRKANIHHGIAMLEECILDRSADLPFTLLGNFDVRAGSKTVVNSVDYPMPGFDPISGKIGGNVECEPSNFTRSSSD